ncbi:hypothetical protein [Novosphingobium indicum]|nr:hypothetical protein [Novosphingobium indicum]
MRGIAKLFGAFKPHGQSVLGQQISSTLCLGMVLPPSFELLFQWIEARRCFVDAPGGRIGFLFPEAEMKRGWTDHGRPGGTDIEFAAEGNANLRYWFKAANPDVMSRLCVFAKSGGDGSMAAFWLAEDGTQKIVHLGSGSGSVTLCILAEDPVDFLRLLAIGYDEICWGDAYSEPPNANGEFIVEPNFAFRNWIVDTFHTTIPTQATEIVRHPASMDDEHSEDAFWQWVRKHIW